jgi:hypothetical protein
MFTIGGEGKNQRKILNVLYFSCLLMIISCKAISGPLTVHPKNPRYFSDKNGNPIYLTGSHTWGNLQDWGKTDPPHPFKYNEFLDFLNRSNHNFTRLWTWESTRWVRPRDKVNITPMPYERTGPGVALDGGPKFDLDKFNEEYFDRLRSRVSEARNRNIYVGVMLFQGFSVGSKDRRKGRPWIGHPYNKANNINGINGDMNDDGQGYEIHTLDIKLITRLQEAYVRKVIDTLNDLDNIIYEISNESHGGSTAWQYHMIKYIKSYEANKPKQHLVWMSYQWDNILGSGTNAELFRSPADIVSPAKNDKTGKPGPWRNDPPAADGTKIVILDTDHLWGIGGDSVWVWKSFTRGLHAIFMDPYDVKELKPRRYQGIRRAMGDVRRYAEKVALVYMKPTMDKRHCSTGYCLCNAGTEYLVLQPERGASVKIGQLRPGTKYEFEWFGVRTGQVEGMGKFTADTSSHSLTPPFDGPAVLHIKAETVNSEAIPAGRHNKSGS